jgi:hypothetical protein
MARASSVPIEIFHASPCKAGRSAQMARLPAAFRRSGWNRQRINLILVHYGYDLRNF